MEYTTDIIQIGDNIANLTLKEAVELSEYLKVRHGIEPAAGTPVIQQQPQKQQQEIVPVQTEFSVIYDGYDEAKKVNVIKTIRELTGLGIKEAKEYVEGTGVGKAIKEALPKQDAETLKQKLELAGAKISVK